MIDDQTLPPRAEPADLTSDFANPSPAPPRPASPTLIPGYEILGELGRGGMGVVFRARDTRLNRPVALKMVLAGDLASVSDRQRFLAEAEAVASLSHPGIVQVYEFGTHGEQPYFALEFCAGGSLADTLRDHPLTPPDAADVVEKLARAIQHAHDKGIVHRDLKPANVLLTGDGLPKVTDFGLAKRVEGGSGLTQTGAILGTPSYMAPEQANGDLQAVGPPADVYALGAILYECLAGRPPFRAATPIDTVLQVVNDEPVPLRRLAPQSPADLETIAHKCLQKEPTQRYASAVALGDDLGRWRNGEPIAARPASVAEKVVKWVRRHRLLAAAIAAVVVSHAVGTSLTIWQAVRASRNATLAEANAAEANAAGRKVERDRALQGVGLAYADWRVGATSRLGPLFADCPPDERGWDWHYVKSLANSALAVWQTPDARGDGGEWVNGLAYTADGRSLVSLSRDGMLLVRDAVTGEVTRTIVAAPNGYGLPNGSLARVTVAAAHSKRRVAAPAGDNAIGVWDVDSGDRLALVRFPDRKPHVGAVNADGTKLAVAGGGRGAVLLNTQGMTEAGRVAFDEDAFDIAFLPDGRLAAATPSGMRLIDVATGRAVTCQPANSTPLAAAVSPDGRYVVGAMRGGSLRVWHATDGRLAANVPGAHFYFAHAVAFSPDGRHLASAGWLGGVRLWEVDTWREVTGLRGHTSTVSSLAFHPDGTELVSGDFAGNLFLWDGYGKIERRRVYTLTTEGVNAVAAAPDGDRVAFVAGQSVHLWDAANGLAPVAVRVGNVNEALAITADGSRVAAGATDGTVGVYDTATGRAVWTKSAGPKAVNRVALDGDTLLAAACEDGVVRLFDAATGDGRGEFGPHAGSMTDLVALGPGRFLVGSFDATVRLWDAATGEGTVLVKAPSEVCRVAMHEPSGLLAATTFGQQVVVWRDRGQTPAWTAGGLPNEPKGLAISPAGDRVFVGSAGQVTVYDAATGKELLNLPGHNNLIRDLKLCRDGRRLLTASWEGSVGVWDVGGGDRRAVLRADERGRREQQMFAARRLNQHFAIAAQLDRLISSAERNASARLLGERGLRRAVLGRTREALADLEEAQKRGAAGNEGEYRGAALLLQMALGESAKYRAAFAALTNPLALALIPADQKRLIAMVGCLAPDAVDDPKRLVAMLGPGPDVGYMFVGMRAAALFRCGDLDGARARVGESMKLHPAGGSPFDWLYLSLIESKSGNRDAAKQWYDKAAAWMAANSPDAIDLPGLRGPPPEMVWIVFTVLRAEAERALK